jgi:hypothetical protein
VRLSPRCPLHRTTGRSVARRARGAGASLTCMSSAGLRYEAQLQKRERGRNERESEQQDGDWGGAAGLTLTPFQLTQAHPPYDRVLRCVLLRCEDGTPPPLALTFGPGLDFVACSAHTCLMGCPPGVEGSAIGGRLLPTSPRHQSGVDTHSLEEYTACRREGLTSGPSPGAAAPCRARIGRLLSCDRQSDHLEACP